MLSLAWMVYLSVQLYRIKVPQPHRHEVCPHALYFIKHGEHASWTKHKRLLCHIGAHDFYGDK